MTEARPGIKVPMGTHEVTVLQARIDGFELTCSCGWDRSVLFPAYVDQRSARQEALGHHANHVRHMTLVHEVQTHSDRHCGRSCIYPRNPGGTP